MKCNSQHEKYLICILCIQQQELYEIEEKKLTSPQEHIDLSLKLMRRSSSASNLNDENVAQPAVRRIDVAEISSGVQSQLDQYGSNENGVNRFAGQMSRVEKKMQAVRVSTQFFWPFFPLLTKSTLNNFYFIFILQNLRQVETSYDFAKKTGPFYMP